MIEGFNYISKKLNRWGELLKKENNIDKIVGLFFIFNVIIRVIFSCVQKVLIIYPDELIYLDIARSIADSGEILIHGMNNGWSQILYPLFISPFMKISDTEIQILLISIFNCIYMCSSILPMYKLCKNMLNNPIYILLCTIIFGTLPDFSMSITFMSENLFYPISIWIIYLVFKFINDKNKSIQKTYRNAMLLGILISIAYFTKSIALYFIIGYGGLLFYDFFIKKNIKFKEVFIQGTVFIFSFVIIYFCISKSLNSGLSVYEKMLEGSFRLNSFYDIVFFSYAIIHYMIITLLAFMIFPLFIPLFNFVKYKEESQRFLVFGVITLLSAIIVIVGLISMKEDYGIIHIRYHARYFSALFSIFLVLLFQYIEKYYEPLKEKTKHYFSNIMFIVGSLMIFLVKIPHLSPADGMIISFYSKYIGGISQSDKLYINKHEIIVKLLIILVMWIGIRLLQKQTARKFIILFSMGAILINILNNATTIDNLYEWYKDNRINNIEQVKEINEFIKKIDGNIMVLTSNQQEARVLDTYIDQKVYSVEESYILDNTKDGEEPYLDLNMVQLQSNYPYELYEKINTIDYIIVPIKSDVSIYNVQEVNIDGIRDYKILKNINTEKIYIKEDNFFPEEVGYEHHILASEQAWLTQHKYEKGKYISIGTEGALIFGPYEPITKGKYDITIKYNYHGSAQEESEVGSVDINLVDTSQIPIKVPLKANGGIVNFQVDIWEDIEKAELRIFTNQLGLEFIEAIIKKVE